jgi:FkbM family methyltransferase
MALTFLECLAKPEYLWRPQQLLKRIFYRAEEHVVRLPLPWGFSIYVRPAETLGRAIATQGVYDLPVTEAILRLADAGEVGLDAGANVGYMSLVLGRAVGPSGSVVSFEPNPVILPRLRQNLELWHHPAVAPIRLEAYALSSSNGDATLGLPDQFAWNEGTAGLDVGGAGVHVIKRCLDSLGLADVGVMKIDVEGHEAEVLRGASEMLKRHAIRDIVFEEHRAFPAASHQMLVDFGYTVFRISRSLFGPLLLSPDSESRQKYLPSNYLATAERQRAERRFAPRGWQALRARSASR